MAEPMATLTDYAIALECLLFAGLLLRRGGVHKLWAAVFGSVGGAALLGGTYHGFAEVISWEHRIWLWHGVGLALAIASFLTLVATACSLPRGERLGLLALATAKLALVLGVGTTFLAFALRVADYLSALVILLLVQGSQSIRQRRPKAALAWLGAGVAISGLAAGVLLVPWPGALAISPLAGYHLVQMVALYCIYCSVHQLSDRGSAN